LTEERLPGSGPRISVDDPDYWIEWWRENHASEYAWGDLAFFLMDIAVRAARAPQIEQGPTSARIGVRVASRDEEPPSLEVNVTFWVERGGRESAVHIAAIRTPGDPLPPWADA